MTHELTLYYRPTCPFCVKVLDLMKAKGLSIPMKNISEITSFRSDLELIGGKTQVPCLVIDGKALYESNDIIEWLDKNCGQP